MTRERVKWSLIGLAVICAAVGFALLLLVGAGDDSGQNLSSSGDKAYMIADWLLYIVPLGAIGGGAYLLYEEKKGGLLIALGVTILLFNPVVQWAVNRINSIPEMVSGDIPQEEVERRTIQEAERLAHIENALRNRPEGAPRFVTLKRCPTDITEESFRDGSLAIVDVYSDYEQRLENASRIGVRTWRLYGEWQELLSSETHTPEQARAQNAFLYDKGQVIDGHARAYCAKYDAYVGRKKIGWDYTPNF